MEALPALKTKLNDEYHHLFKIVLLGNDGIGKSQFLNRWIANKYNEQSLNTIGVEFASKLVPYKDEILKDKIIKFQIWDTAGQDRYRSIITSYTRGAALAIIFVDQKESPENKTSQIRYWANIIDENKSGTKIAIIETKSDVPEARPLSSSELIDLKIDYVFHQTFSSHTGDGLSTLTINLNSIMPQLIEAADKKDNSKKSSTLKTDLVITEQLNLAHITNDQAKMIIQSLKDILIHGPLNEADKSYSFSIFGGGKTLIPNPDKSDIKYTIPEHVQYWIGLINLAAQQESQPNNYINLLSLLFKTIKTTAYNKRFSRSSTTQDFYENGLPSLLKHCVISTPENGHLNYFAMREKIANLDSQDADNVLQRIKTLLEIGPSYVDKKTPYQIGFFGGKKYTTQDGQIIKAPDHVASILEYINRDIRPIINQEKLLTVYHYLVIARHSKSSSRNESTQSFYDNLPIEIADELNRINPMSKPPAPAHL